MSVETRIKAEQDRVEKIEAKLAELEATLDKQLLSDNQTTVPQLDAEIAAERRALARCQKTIALLTEQQKREIEATARKNKNQHIDRVQDEIGEYRKCIVRLAKHLADSVKDWHEAQDRAVRLAAAWNWGNSDRIAAGFDLDEITRDVKHELCRIGSGQLFHAGAIQRPSFPGGLNPKLDWLHSPEKIPALVDVIDQRHSIAKKVLNASRSIVEIQMEKAS